VIFPVGRFDQERLDIGQRLKGLVHSGGAARFGQHQTATGTRQHPPNAISREMWLDRQVDATGLENRQNRGQPIQISLRQLATNQRL
jgi:hypothetical protein